MKGHWYFGNENLQKILVMVCQKTVAAILYSSIFKVSSPWSKLLYSLKFIFLRSPEYLLSLNISLFLFPSRRHTNNLAKWWVPSNWTKKKHCQGTSKVQWLCVQIIYEWMFNEIWLFFLYTVYNVKKTTLALNYMPMSKVPVVSPKPFLMYMHHIIY